MEAMEETMAVKTTVDLLTTHTTNSPMVQIHLTALTTVELLTTPEVERTVTTANPHVQTLQNAATLVKGKVGM